MNDDLTKLQALLQARAAAAEAQAGLHLTPEQLTAYHFQELDAAAAEQVQRHLVQCRTCMFDLLAFAELCTAETEETPKPLQISTSTASTTPSFFQRRRAQFSPFPLIPAFAVLSLVLTLAMIGWIVSLRREKQTLLAQLTARQTAGATAATQLATLQQQRDEALAHAAQAQTQADTARRELEESQQSTVAIFTLPLGETRATDGRPPALEIGKGVTRLALLIPVPPAPKYPHYVLEILHHPTGAPVGREQRLQREGENDLTIDLSCQLFPTGEYRFTVYGLGRNGKTRVSSVVLPVHRK